MFSEELNLWLGTWNGSIEHQRMTYLRFYHPDGSLVLSPEEEERLEKERERRAKLAERQLKQEAQLRVSDVLAEKDAALAEVERLRKLLEEK